MAARSCEDSGACQSFVPTHLQLASEFHEFTIVMEGSLRVEHSEGVIEVKAGQAVHTVAGEWVRHSTAGEEGAEYVAVCLPAFAPDIVHREG